ncbi:MAG: hypothetical protein WD887_00865 [Candidatus Saccharimonadales bacterium]
MGVEDVLFVCRSNIGRSQVAMELYNRLNSKLAESAGTLVDSPGQKVGEWEGSAVVVQVMKEDYGIDISGNQRRQLDKQMLVNFGGKVIVMAEMEAVPPYLLGHGEREFWEVPDLKDQDAASSRAIIKNIQERIERLHNGHR